MTSEYIKATLALPKEYDTVWVRVCGRRPMKMYRIGNRFLYCNETLHKNGNYASISERVLWKYCKNQGTMSREEEIKQAADTFGKWGDESRDSVSFECGAEWADQHPRKGLVDIEKVEKVLGNLLFNKEEKIYTAYLDYDAFFEDFRKAMEE